ncbi:AMP-binding protein [Mesorhizobium sp. A623]
MRHGQYALRRSFRPHGQSERPFLTLKDGRAISYGEFLRLTARLAHALAVSGIGPGARVTLQAKKSTEALAVYAACITAGAVFLPLNTAYTASEVAAPIPRRGRGRGGGPKKRFLPGRSRAAGRHRPKARPLQAAARVFLIDELPRNTMGKVQKNMLRQRFGQTFDAGK